MVVDKIYEVTSINWLHFALEARKTDLRVADVHDSEVFPLENFTDFKVRLVNRSGIAKIIDFEVWKERRGGK